VDVEVSNRIDEVPERFVPDEMEGDLVEAEHLVRYWWASSLAPARRVLDAGCGVGYGTNLLAAAGAVEAVGVDVAPSVVEAAEATAGPGVRYQTADVHHLPFDDASFDLVVCFEVIEHVSGAEGVIAELARVLGGDGVLLVSSPNPDAYVPGNPHHVRELRADELEEMVRSSLPHTAVRRQFDWVSSAIVDDTTTGDTALDPIAGLEAGKVASQRPGSEPYAIVAGSRAPLPELAVRLVATGLAEPKRWLERYAEQQGVLFEQRDYIERQDATLAEAYELNRQLRVSEAQFARLRAEHDATVEYVGQLEDRLDRAARVLRDMQQSPSWRMTAPLRKLKNVGPRR
jgi:2-polyprenyl-3-methyl-5-hydroxy-6-metoxy-1,4-benzoquinol methylase